MADVHLHPTSAFLLAGTIVLGLSGQAGTAREMVPVYGAVESGPSVSLSNTDGTSPYASVVRYDGRATCSGVFLDTDPRSSTAPAYVLTNGHCVDFSGANDVLLDQPVRRGRAVFNYFTDTVGAQVAIPARRLAYATMKGRDVAIVELGARYVDLVRRGFRPWKPTPTMPRANESIAVVGAPLFAPPVGPFLRLAVCRNDGRAPTLTEFRWHWFDAERNTCADIGPGSSGSAVISRETGHLLGLINTTTRGASPLSACSLDHPCEPSREGIVSRRDTNYMTPLARINRCFDNHGWFDVNAFECPLDPGYQAQVRPSHLFGVNPNLSSLPIGQPVTRWNVRVSGVEYYRYKVVLAATEGCRDLRGYSAARAVADQPVIEEALPRIEGVYFLCVLGGASSIRATQQQSVAFPTVVVARVDLTAPAVAPRITISEGDLAWRVTFGFIPPELTIYIWKFGRPAETRCDDPSGYSLALLPFYSLDKRGRPYAVCVVAFDDAGNRTPPGEYLLP